MQRAQSSFQISEFIVNQIVEAAKREVSINRLIKNNLTQYCSTEGLKYYHEIFNENQRMAENNQQCICQGEPNALIYDNFFPSATELQQPVKKIIDHEQTKSKTDKRSRANTLSRNTTLKQPQQPTIKRNVSKKIEEANNFHKLNLPQQQPQQAILKQLRKQRADSQTKRSSSELQSGRKQNGVKRSPDQKVSYDYNGSPINVKLQNRNNLLSDALNGQTLNQVQKTKHIDKNSIFPTEIQYEKKDKKYSKSKNNNEIQLSNTFSLISEAKITKGIKMTQDGRVIQERQKMIPVNQLIKTLGTRKLKKQQYIKIKESSRGLKQLDDRQDTKRSIIQNQKNQQINLSQLRSASQSKLSNSIYRNNTSIVTVNDEKLLETLISNDLQPNTQLFQKQIINKNINKSQSQSKLSKNDKYNLQYIKSGNQQLSKARSSASLGDVVLPKINSSRNQVPKIREKLKYRQEVIRNIKRKFQQKLRI